MANTANLLREFYETITQANVNKVHSGENKWINKNDLCNRIQEAENCNLNP